MPFDSDTRRRKLLFRLIPGIWIAITIMFVAFDGKWIFPFQSDSDLNFQIGVEAACILISAGISTIWAVAASSPRVLTVFRQRSRWQRGFVQGLPWGISMFLLRGLNGLRNHHFNAWAFVAELFLWMLAGWGYGYATSRGTKPVEQAA